MKKMKTERLTSQNEFTAAFTTLCDYAFTKHVHVAIDSVDKDVL